MKKATVLAAIVLALVLLVSCIQDNTIDQLAYTDYLTREFDGYEYTGLPTIEIETPGHQKITREAYVDDATFKIIEDTEMDELVIKIKGRGKASWVSSNKKGYNIKFDDKTSVLDMKAAKKWTLIGNMDDHALLRNWLSGYLANEVMDRDGASWSPSYAYFDFILNGQYMGNYIMAESIQINKNRVNIKNIEDYDESQLNKGGFILEIDFRLDSTWYFHSAVCNLPFTLKDPDFDDADATVYVAHMKGIVDAVEAELTADDFAQKDIADITTIDVASFVDWYIVEEFAKNLDADFFSSVYMYYDPSDHRMHMGPHWDFDKSFGNNDRKNSDDKDCANPEGYWISDTQNPGARSWYEFLLANDSFVAALKTRWCEIRYAFAGAYSAVDAAIDAQAEQIEKSAEYNFKRWKVLGTNLLTDALGITKLSTFTDEVEKLKSWIKLRYEWLDSQWGNP